MSEKHRNEKEKPKTPQITYSPRDRLLRAWENTMELVRDFESYSKEIEDEQAAEVFSRFAEEEGLHASKLREMLHERRMEQ